MKIIITASLLLVLALTLTFFYLKPKVEIINSSQLEKLKGSGNEPKLSHWLYKGTEGGYHYLSHVDLPKAVEYKILVDELEIGGQFPLTSDSGQWRLLQL
jgi:hypothetical protein